MRPVFLIWCGVAALFAGIGLYCRRASRPMAFFAGVEAPTVKDAATFNRAVSRLWLISASVFAGLGVPFLFLENNTALMVLPLVGVPLLCIGMAVSYHIITLRHGG